MLADMSDEILQFITLYATYGIALGWLLYFLGQSVNLNLWRKFMKGSG